MSTRSSGYYANGIHLFHELNYDTLCADFPEEDHMSKENKDKQYNSFTMPIKDWREFARSILKKCDEIDGGDNG